MDKIKFQEKEYPTVLLNFPFGERRISTESLNDALMNYDGSYVSNEARIIDEKIFYFVEDGLIRNDKSELVNKILSEI